MISALILSAETHMVLRGMRSEAEDVKDAISEAAFADVDTTPVATEGWQQPVLNATGSAVDARYVGPSSGMDCRDG